MMVPRATARARTCVTIPRAIARPLLVRPSTRSIHLSNPILASSEKHTYSDTLNLPNTTFPNRSSPDLIKSTILPQTTSQLYKWNLNNNDAKRNDLFILHDGPPYANGGLHLGHALNKILKDIINRYELINGKKIIYKPGWDCHGLPIELKALEKLELERTKSLKSLKKKLKQATNDDNDRNSIQSQIHALQNTKLSPFEIRQIASKHADTTISSQKEAFRQFGIMGDWDNPYITKDKHYVIDQLKIFKRLFDKGLVQRQEKPVYWGCENASALAEGELEYNDAHKSTACFVKFPIINTDLSALIWTSTPWTLPANKAICINKDLEYWIVQSSTHGKLIIAKDLFDKVSKLDESLTKIDTIETDQLLKLQYTNPLLSTDSNTTFPIFHGAHVTNSAGTGLVHTAPGHGHDDYFVCLQYGIKPYSPVDDHGCYTRDLPEKLHDLLLQKQVLTEGNKLVISALESLGSMFHKSEYTHSYPYDWRSKKPIVIRSTPQWFINVDKIKPDTIAALEKVGFYPERGSKRLVSFIKTRNEWCISRQRSWGVPIPVLYHKTTGEALLTDESIDKIISVIETEGPNSWFDSDNNNDKWVPTGVDHTVYNRCNETMDVWFDSGSSWTVVEKILAKENISPESRGYLADVYLEGSDQHRGWFQSSLLTKIAIDKEILPYKKIITHGFTLDESGSKMSKSLGNTIDPISVIEGDRKLQLPKLGIDGLRLWVAQADYSTDMSVGPTILSRVGDNLKKIRFTLKFLLGNLNNQFQPVAYDKLRPLDKYILSELTQMEHEIKMSYEVFNYSKIIRTLNLNMNVMLSSIYFDISKDSLYTEPLNSVKRRSIQTVLAIIYRTYISILSPILPIITQEAWNHTPSHLKKTETASPFENGWNSLPSEYIDLSLKQEFDIIWELRDKSKVLLDRGNRVDKVFKNSLETIMFVEKIDGMGHAKTLEILQKHESYLDEYCLTSKFMIQNNDDATTIESIYSDTIKFSNGESLKLHIAKSDLHKCPRCWKYNATIEDDLCHRCADAVQQCI